MVNMPHDSYNRGPGQRFAADFLFLLLHLHYIYFICQALFDLIAEISCHQSSRINIQNLVYRRHDTKPHKLGNDLIHFYRHLVGQVTDADSLKHLDTLLNGPGLCWRRSLLDFFLSALRPPQPPWAVLIIPIGAESSAILTFSAE